MYHGPERRVSTRPREHGSKLFGYAVLFATGVAFGVLFFYGLTG